MVEESWDRVLGRLAGWVPFHPTPGGCTICTGMCGSGAPTGTVITQGGWRWTRAGRVQAGFAPFAEAVGRTMATIAVRPHVSSTRLVTDRTPLGSAQSLPRCGRLKNRHRLQGFFELRIAARILPHPEKEKSPPGACRNRADSEDSKRSPRIASSRAELSGILGGAKVRLEAQ